MMDPAFRLFLGVLISYPIMGVYRKLVRRMAINWHHLYFLTTGLCTSYFVLGLDGPVHGVLAGTMTWIVLRGMGATTLSTAAVFVLQIVHLSVINAATLNNENLVSTHILWVSSRVVIDHRNMTEIGHAFFQLYSRDRRSTVVIKTLKKTSKSVRRCMKSWVLRKISPDFFLKINSNFNETQRNSIINLDPPLTPPLTLKKIRKYKKSVK